MTTRPDTSPNSPARDPQKTGGLFDTGVAGSTRLGVLPAESSTAQLLEGTRYPNHLATPSLDTLDTTDLLLEGFTDILSPNAGLSSGFDFAQLGNCGEFDALGTRTNNTNAIKTPDASMLTSQPAPLPPSEDAQAFLPDDLLGNLEGGLDFLEQFTDLSSYSNGGEVNAPLGGAAFDADAIMRDMEELMAENNALLDAAVTMAPSPPVAAQVKRSASEALDAEDELFTPVNPDHNDYTRKPVFCRPAKRPRTSTLASLASESDAESVVSSSTAFSVPSPAPSTSTSGATRDNKYLERRRKNNIASRRSRETRKQKFQSMDRQADELEAKNRELRLRVAELERLTKIMKESLVAQLANAGKAASTAALSQATG